MPTHPLHFQQVFPDGRQCRLDLSLWRFITLHRIGTPLRLRQSLPVHLPILPQRQLLHPHIGRRHHVLRQSSPYMFPHLFRSYSSCSCSFSPFAFLLASLPCFAIFAVRVIRHQPFVSTSVFPRHHYRPSYSTMLHQPLFYLPQLYPVSPHLHLVVIPPQKLDVPVLQPFPQVSTSITPRSPLLAKPVWHKPLRRQFRTLQISTPYSRSPDIQLSCYSHRHRLHLP